MLREINLTPTSSPFEITHGSQSIVGRSWGQSTDCRAVVLLVHGLGAHSGWFEAFARQLKVRRVHAVAYDQIGFGRRRTEEFETLSQWIDDLLRVFDQLKETAGERPVYVLGNSMGALLALAASQYISPAGLVLCSPALDGCSRTFTLAYRLSALARALVNPDSDIALPYGVDQVCRDEGVRNWLAADEARRFALPGRMLVEVLKLVRQIRRRCREVKVPVLMLTAGQEYIIDNRAADRFICRLQAPGKQVRSFPEAAHDLMFDYLVDEVAEAVVTWMTQPGAEPLVTG